MNGFFSTALPARFFGLTLAVAICLAAPYAAAQVVRLPAVVPLNESSPGRLVSHPGSAAELVQAPGESEIQAEPERPADARGAPGSWTTS